MRRRLAAALTETQSMLLYLKLFLLHQGILLYCDYQASTFDQSKLPSHRFEAMDHFAKCFLILRLDCSHVDGGLNSVEGDSRGWRAVRVDLVSPPVDRYAFTLLGWTGSRVRRMQPLTSPVLIDKTQLIGGY